MNTTHTQVQVFRRAHNLWRVYVRAERETMHRRTTGSMFDLCTQHSSSALLQGMHIARRPMLTLSPSPAEMQCRGRELNGTALHCHYHNLQGKITGASEIKPPPTVRIACPGHLTLLWSNADSPLPWYCLTCKENQDMVKTYALIDKAPNNQSDLCKMFPR